MKHPFLTQLNRSIGESLGRFVAIAGIVALGCGFYAGLGMSGSDMRLAADRFYDGTHLYDLRILSTLGLTDEQLPLITEVEGVEAIMPAYAVDAMATLNNEQYAVRVMSMDFSYARESWATSSGQKVESPNARYLNRLVLAEGSWPVSPSQCVLSADRVMGEPIKVGDTIELMYGSSDISTVLERKTFQVSGLVHSSAFPSSVDLGYTNLGAGTLQQYMYVSERAFKDELPYTEIFVRVRGAADEMSGSEAYDELVQKTADALELVADDISTARLEQIVGEATSEIDEQSDYFEDAKNNATGQLDAAQKDLDKALAQLKDAEKTIGQGEQDFSRSEEELEKARKETEKSLATAKKKLESSQRKVDEGRKNLADGQAKIDAQKKQLNAQEAAFKSDEAAWNAARPGLVKAADSYSQLSSGIKQAQDAASAARATRDAAKEQKAQATEAINTAKTQVANAEAAVAAAQAAYDAADEDGKEAAKAELDAAQTKLSEAQGQLSQAQASQESAAKTIESANAQIEQYKATAEDLKTQREQLKSQVAAQGYDAAKLSSVIANNDAKISSAREKIAQGRAKLQEGQASLNATKAELDRAQKEIDAGWKSYNAQAKKAQEQLDAATKQLEEAKKELDEAKKELEQGRKRYEQGKKDYDSNKKQIDARLGDAAAQLEEARRDVTKLAAPQIYVLDRSKNSGVDSRLADSVRIDSIARVFPLIFFLVAALVALTTMTRMVEDGRTNIGTHKALGFSTPQIAARYVVYALVASLLGGVLGILLLSQLLPFVIQRAYAIIYNVPDLMFPLPIEPRISLVSVGLGTAVTLIAAAVSVAATLREVPASLMRPRQPKPGKRVLLEQFKGLWSKLDFSWKSTLRNLLRYKGRFAMTVIGIAGTTALLLTGLGLHDSIWDIIERQFEAQDPVIVYNMMVGMSDTLTEDELAKRSATLAADLQSRSEGTSIALVRSQNMQLGTALREQSIGIMVMVPQDNQAFESMVHLRERLSAAPLSFDDDAVIITEKLATQLGVGVGDEILLYEQDDIGNTTGAGESLEVTGIAENYVYHYLYLGKHAWADLFEDATSPNTLLAHIEGDADERSELANELHSLKSVGTVLLNTETIDSYRKALSSVNMVVYVLVAAAAALAAIVLYNLINIQLLERTREMASLKVLGFDRTELATYFFRETLIQVLLGSVLGLVLGNVMEGFVVQTAEVDAVMFGRIIHAPSYVLAVVLTVVFSLVVMAAVLPQLASINMVESLKSNE